MSTTEAADATCTRASVRDELVESAHRIGSQWAHTEYALWQDGQLPTELVQEAAAAGLYTLTLPKDAGGEQVDLLTMIDVVAELTSHVAALGWNVMIAQGCGFIGWGAPPMAQEILDHGTHPIFACALAATGTGEELPDTGEGVFYRVTGRWFINSGCQNADWFIAAFGIRSPDGTERHWGEDGVRFALLPMGNLRVEETWNVLGLRATGSHDVIIDDAILVPHHLTFNPFHEPSPRDAPLYKVSYFNYLMAMMAGPVIGLGRRALNAATSDLADEAGNVTAANALILYRIENALRASEAGTRSAITQMWDEVAREGAAGLSTRARVVGAVQHTQRATAAATRELMTLTGTPHSSTSVLASTARDISAIGQHLAYSLVTEHRMAAHLYEGRTPMPFMI